MDGSDYTGGVFPVTINFVGMGGTASQLITITDDDVIYSKSIDIYHNNVDIIRFYLVSEKVDLQLECLSNFPVQAEC